MPVFEVPRKYVQVKRAEIRDSVYVQADSEEEAQELAEDGNFDEIAFSGEETGHHHEYGEIVSSVDAGDPLLSVGSVEKQAATELGRYRIDFHLGANGLLVKVTPSFEAPSDAHLSEVAAGIEGQRFAVGADEYDDELQPMFSDHDIGPFTIKLDRDEDGHFTMFVQAEDKDLGPVDRQISEDNWAGRYVLPSNDSRYHE